MEILGKRSLRGKLTSATLNSLKRRSGRSSASSLHLEDSLHSVSVVQVGIEGERQRLPIFRPLPGKRLTSDPRGDDRHLPSTAFYHYSLNQSLDPPPLSSTSSVSSFPPLNADVTDEEEGREDRLGSASLVNLSIDTDLIDHVTDQQSTQSPPDRPVLGGHLLEGNVLEPSHITPSKYMASSSPHAHQLTNTRQSFQTTNMSLYQKPPNASSAGSVASAQSVLEPLPYQVHSRVLGWKLTSVQRRKELIDVLDMMKERARQGHSLAHTSSKSTANTFNRRVLHTLAPPDSYLHMSDEGVGQGHERGTGAKLSVREVEAWQSYVGRSLRSRQGYRSVTQIKNIMEERRKTEKLTQISSQRHELLRNRKHVRHQNILQDKSTDDVAQLQSRAIYREIVGASTTALSPPSSPSALATQKHYLKPLAAGERDTSSQLLRGGKGSATEFLYNFPVSIHKQRDRMVRQTTSLLLTIIYHLTPSIYL